MKRKIILAVFIIFFASFFGCMFVFPHSANAGSYDYTPMEKIPGFEESTTFPEFVKGLYKFGIWTVGIAALLMLTVGGFLYMTSAGNMSKNETAKGIIRDAIIGLVLALTAYLILYIINPDLVKIRLDLKSVGVGTTAPTASTGTGNCESVASGPCSVDKMKGVCGWDPEKASAICQKESSGIEGKMSGKDTCVNKDASGKKYAFSVGLFQINLTCRKEDSNCVEAFSPKQSSCINFSCSVANTSAYDKCVAKYASASNNIKKACELYNTSTGWDHWSVNKGSNGCGFTK